MKTRIYDVCKEGKTRIELFKVDEEGKENLINLWIYKEWEQNQDVWSRERAINEAKEYVYRLEEIEKEKRELLYEADTEADNCIP